MTLVELLELWRKTRDPRVADALDRASHAVDRPPIIGKTVVERSAAWHAIVAARDPLDVGRIVATPLPRTVKPLTAAVQQLCAWPDDPRIATALVRFAEEDILTTAAGRRLSRTALLRVADIGDVRIVPRLQSLVPTVGARRNSPLAEVLDRLRTRERPELDEATLATIEAIADDPHERELLAAIREAPNDRATIAVLGDHLTEIGDPRGEMIALSLAEPTEIGARRMRELVAAHGRAWAGELDRWFAEDGRVFELGFFAGGKLAAGEVAQAEALAAEPAFAHVRVIAVDTRRELFGAAVVNAAPEIRALGVVNGNVVERLASTTLRELHVRFAEDASVSWARLPGLEILGAWTGPITNIPDVRRIVTTPRAVLEMEALAARGGALRELEIVLSDDPWYAPIGWRVRAERTSDRGPFARIVVLRGEDAADHVGRLALKLAAIPGPWPRELVVEGGRHLMIGAQESRSIELQLGRFTQVAKIEVPWDRVTGAKTVEKVLLLACSGNGAIKDVAPSIWTLLGELGQRYDVFTVNYNDTMRPLGKKPLERVMTWAAKASTYSLVMTQTGGAARLDLSSGSASAVIVRNAFDDEALLAWIRGAIANLGFERITLHGDNEIRAGSSSNAFGTIPTLGWVTVFGGRIRTFLSVESVGTLADDPALPDLTVEELGDRLVVILGPSPASATPAALDAYERGLRALLLAELKQRRGYDFPVEARAVLDPIAARFGLVEVAGREPLALEYRTTTPAGLQIRFWARLELGIDQPRDAPAVMTVAINAWPRVENDGYHTLGSDDLIRNAADLAAQLARVVAKFAELTPWLTELISPP